MIELRLPLATLSASANRRQGSGIARNATDCETAVRRHERFPILDRDVVFSPRLETILECSGVEILMAAYQAPNMNAHAERSQQELWNEIPSGARLHREGGIEASEWLGGLV